ncbi:hypothetical protein [Neobacillus sp. 114]|uniref:hypothetical protein n=1 Tax=Neobacillus sp. 114 TaxID=3048535 RepID=UPI0024C21152|nr:hypothetical protein [Neobacillus sp. 114]
MQFEMQKAIMLAENINNFIKFVHKTHGNKNSVYVKADKVYQIKLIMEEFQYQIIADELIRINRYSWDEKYTHYLIDRFQEGLGIIEEYVKINYDDLFIFSGRLYSLKNLSLSFSK